MENMEWSQECGKDREGWKERLKPYMPTGADM